MSLKALTAVSSDLDLFNLPVVNTSILQADYVEYKPVQSIGTGPIVFHIGGVGDRYVDAQRTLLRVRMKVTDSAGKNYAKDAKISLANYPLNTLFSDVKVELNQTQIASASHMYHYRSYIETLLTFNDSAKKSHLTSGLFVQDEAGKLDDLTATALVKRGKYIAEGAEVELFGRIHTDITSQSKLVLNETDIRFSFFRNDASIVCMGTAGLTPLIEITDCSLFVRKCLINPSVLIAHSKLLQSGTKAKYPIHRVEMYNYSIPQGVQRFCLENLFTQRLPTRIIMGMVKSSAFNGAIAESCFNFHHFNINLLSLSIDGQVTSGTPLAPDFDKGFCMQSFANTFMNCGNYFQDDGWAVDRDEFQKGGLNLFAYDLTVDLSASENYWSIQNEGNCRLEMGWSKALEQVTTCILFCEFRDVIQADKQRHYSLDYIR